MTHCSEHIECMANPVCEVLVTEAELKAPPLPANFRPPEAGAAIDFWGIVRGMEDEREIDGIEYEAHWEMAEYQLKQIAKQATDRFVLQLVIIHHRIGFIAVGASSLFARVASAHRAEAFRASQWLVDELKKKVPIWKRPRFKVESLRRASQSETATAK